MTVRLACPMRVPRNFEGMNATATAMIDPSEQVIRIAEIHREIGKLLHERWDPIGVNPHPEAAGEYAGHVRAVYDIAVKSRSSNDIAEHLLGIEQSSMGLLPRPLDQLVPVAQQILDLVAQIPARMAPRDHVSADCEAGHMETGGSHTAPDERGGTLPPRVLIFPRE